MARPPPFLPISSTSHEMNDVFATVIACEFPVTHDTDRHPPSPNAFERKEKVQFFTSSIVALVIVTGEDEIVGDNVTDWEIVK
jgi:hypothetical protein